MWTLLQLVWPDRRWRSQACLVGRTFVVTGGSSGIGLEVVRQLAATGARVVVGCRDTAKGELAVQEMDARNVVVRHLDLASLASVRRFASELLLQEPQIHVLINNAGIGACPHWKTADGFEMQFGVNHLGHFLLTLLLLDRLKESSPSRIVNVSSVAHYLGKINFDDINFERNYSPIKAYQRSKLANILFTRELAKRLEGTNVTTYCLHPGVVHSDLGRHLGESLGSFRHWLYHLVSRLFFKSLKAGAQTTLFCALEEALIDESGYYYSGCRRMEPSARAKDDRAAKRLWELSEELTGSDDSDQ